jgi:hypothetical protein
MNWMSFFAEVVSDWLENFDIDWAVGESWPEYIKGTKELCKAFIAKVSLALVISYMILFSFVGIVFIKKGRRILGASGRLAVIALSVYLLFIAAKSHVDQSGWAADIRNGRRYTSTVENDRMFAIGDVGPTTYPTKYDVLIETRYGSDHLAMYNDYIPLGHPGNYFLRALVDRVSPIYDNYGQDLKNATERYLWDSVTKNQGRFLYQGPDGLWMLMDFESVLSYIRDELSFASNQDKAQVNLIMRRITSHYKYGEFRNTALSIRHSVPYMDSLRNQILRKAYKSQAMDTRPKQSKIFYIFREVSPPPFHKISTKRTHNIPFSAQAEPPFTGAWLVEGNEAETYDDGTWYYAVIQVVTGRGDVLARFADGSIERVDIYSIRPFVEYRVGEQLWCFDRNDDFLHWCTIQGVSSDGMSFIVTLLHDGRELSLRLGELRRQGEPLLTKLRWQGPSYHDM